MKTVKFTFNPLVILHQRECNNSVDFYKPPCPPPSSIGLRKMLEAFSARRGRRRERRYKFSFFFHRVAPFSSCTRDFFFFYLARLFFEASTHCDMAEICGEKLVGRFNLKST